MQTNLKLYPSATMSGDLISHPFSISRGFSLQAQWVGTPVGQLKIQISNDKTDSTLWTDVLDSFVSTGGIAGSHIYETEIDGTSVKFARLVYTRTSGTGTLLLNRGQMGGELSENLF